jgi:sterol desaturase/sphingolipid hydroxylase (fatty acid hydroxylase superfamily)
VSKVVLIFGAIMPVFIMSCFTLALEMTAPREAITLRSRLFGWIVNLLNTALIAIIIMALVQVWRIAGIEPVLAGMNFWLQAVIVLLTYDFLRYVEHRVEHAIWWPVHGVHHSIRDLNSANAYGHPLQAVPEYVIVAIPLSFLGMTAPVVVLWASAFWSLFIHSPITIGAGPLRRIFVDPAFHRIHHSTDPRHWGKNFGIMFSIWDQLFGTAYFPKHDEWPDVGLEDRAPPRNIFAWLIHPAWRPASSQRPR